MQYMDNYIMKTIVDTMSLADVGLLILEKAEDISKKMGSYIKNEKEPSYKRIIYKRGEEKIFFKPIKCSEPNIDFYLCPSCISKSDYKKYGLRLIIAAQFRYCGQFFYANVVLDQIIGNQLLIYTTHFLERYIERHLKDKTTPKSFDTFYRFLRETDGKSIGILNETYELHNGDIQAVTSIGNLCEEVIHPNVILVKTFIDNDTIVRGPKKEANNLGNTITKYTEFDKLGRTSISDKIRKHFKFAI